MSGNLKISQLTPSSAASADLIPFDRSGSNFSVSASSIANLLSSSIGLPNAGSLLKNAAIDATINQQSSGSGDISLYTVPAGKRAIIGMLIYNSSGGRLNTQSKMTIGGVTYALGAAAAINTNLMQQGAVIFNTYPIGEAGDIFKINVDGAGLNTFGYVISFDNTSPLKSPRVASDGSSTTYTVYTCPAGKKAYSFNAVGSNAPIRVYNTSGGTRTYNLFAVPNGGSTGSTNKIASQFTVNNGSSSSQALGSLGFAPGDSFQVTTDAGTTTQLFAIQNLIEV